MSYPKVDFLYLDEKDMIKAGVTNMHHCVEVMTEVYDILGKGDYVMGGKNHNSHGQKIKFPKTSQFPNMPTDGPDRRFMAMVAYIGGRFNVCGEKWYGSNRENLKKGLPRSVLMTMLNDADTGAPLALQSANLLSAVRTGAIPGVGAKYLARPDSKVVGLVAAGAISRTCFMGIADVCRNIDKVKIYDIFPSASKKLASFIREEYPHIKDIEIVDSMEAAVRDSDIVNAATSGVDIPYFKEEWLKPGVYMSLPASAVLDKDFVVNRARNVVDNWKMYEAYSEELEFPFSESMGGLTGHYLDWIHDGRMDVSQIENLGDIVAGNIQGRKSDEEIILFCMGGQPVYDVAWGYTIYEKAKEMGLGKVLNLWDKPYLY